MHFDHRESFQMNVREAISEPSNQIKVVVERKVRMQASDNVKLCRSFRYALSRASQNFIKSEGVCSRRIG